METLGMTQRELVEAMGRPERLIASTVNERSWVSTEAVLDLQASLGISAEHWLNLKMRYNLIKALQKRDSKAG